MPANLACAQRPAASLDSHLDPVGACVGPKGSRVRMVVSELRGERIDVVLWDGRPGLPCGQACRPLAVTWRSPTPEPELRDGWSSPTTSLLAIGGEGQNARLAARLTGRHIDIKNESLAANLVGTLAPLVDETVTLDEDGRCAYIDSNGVRCRNQARPGSHFCSVHQGSRQPVREEESFRRSRDRDGARTDALPCGARARAVEVPDRRREPVLAETKDEVRRHADAVVLAVTCMICARWRICSVACDLTGASFLAAGLTSP